MFKAFKLIVAILGMLAVAACSNLENTPNGITDDALAQEWGLDQWGTAPSDDVNEQLDFVDSGLEPQSGDYQNGVYAKAYLYAHIASSLWHPYIASKPHQYNRRFDQEFWSGDRNHYPYIDNEVLHLGTGVYAVRLRHMNTFGGHVQVVAYRTSNHCKVWKWFPYGIDLHVKVRCYNSSGMLADTRFDVWFFKQSKRVTSNSIAYLWSHVGSPGIGITYTPTQWYNHTSGSGLNTVEHVGTGSYDVTFRNAPIRSKDPAGKGGIVLVTAYGANGRYCKVGSWSGSPHVTARIYCYNSSGMRTDAMFNAMFIRHAGMLGTAKYSDRQKAAYVYNDICHTSTTGMICTPSATWQHNTESPTLSTVERLAKGRYRVTIDDFKGKGKSDPKVVAYGSDDVRCSIYAWDGSLTFGPGSEARVRVYCYNSSGGYENSRFNLYYQAN